MILIVDMNWKPDSLGYNEFVAPIMSAIEPLEECEVKHFLDVRPDQLGGSSKVILSGTTLKDHTTLKQAEKFEWIKTCEKPILGICAGLQTIAIVFGIPLRGCLQVGMAEISTVAENPLFKGCFKAYTLHNYSIAPNPIFETLAESPNCIQAVKHKQKRIYAVLFHPEVRNQEILKRFIALK
jgi:GMP synthase-like glutamine amidotransferase